MIDPHALLLRVEVPFEIWIILVVCTGGIYLLVGLFKRDPPGSKEIKQDLGTMIAEVTRAIVSGNGDKLPSIVARYPYPAETGRQIVLMVKMTLDGVSSAGQLDENAINKIKHDLSAKGVPDHMIPIILTTVLGLFAQDGGVRGNSGPDPPGSKEIKQDLGTMIAEVTRAIVSGNGDKLPSIVVRYPYPAETTRQIVLMVKMTLEGVWSAGQLDENAINKIKHDLSAKGVPDHMIPIIVTTVLQDGAVRSNHSDSFS